MAFEWKDDSASDGPPEKIRRRLQAQVEAHFARRAAKAPKRGPATRVLLQAMPTLPKGKPDLSRLSPQQRFSMAALHAAAMHEQQEFLRKKKLNRITRPKRHEAVVLVPRCLTAPYSTSVSFTTPNPGSGFNQHDGGLPQQPNGQPILADPVNGVVGQTMLWESDAPTAFMDVTRGVLIGGWIQAGATTPRFLEANLTTVTIPPPNSGNGGLTDGWIDLFGGGVCTFQLSIELLVFTDASQSTKVPPNPVMTAITPVMNFSEAPIHTVRFMIPSNTHKSPSGSVNGVSSGTWLLVLAGPVAHFLASVWHSDWSIGVDTTWSVDKICAYW